MDSTSALLKLEIGLGTPALLFPAISMLLLAYSTKFLSLTQLVRSLHTTYQTKKDPRLLAQIKSLRTRIRLIRDMQTLAITSLFGCVFCMFSIYGQMVPLATYTFALSLLILLGSLALCVWENYLSTRAINIQIADIEHDTASHHLENFLHKLHIRPHHHHSEIDQPIPNNTTDLEK